MFKKIISLLLLSVSPTAFAQNSEAKIVWSQVYTFKNSKVFIEPRLVMGEQNRLIVSRYTTFCAAMKMEPLSYYVGEVDSSDRMPVAAFDDKGQLTKIFESVKPLYLRIVTCHSAASSKPLPFSTPIQLIHGETYTLGNTTYFKNPRFKIGDEVLPIFQTPDYGSDRSICKALGFKTGQGTSTQVGPEDFLNQPLIKLNEDGDLYDFSQKGKYSPYIASSVTCTK